MDNAATLGSVLDRSSAAEATMIVGNKVEAVVVRATHDLAEVEAVWRGLEAQGIESPGQSFDFIREWIAAHRIAPANTLFVTASLGGHPMALLALYRRRRGVTLYSWFPGAHVGCGAPLLDRQRFATLDDAGRADFWRQVMAGIRGADLVYLKAVPERAYGLETPFARIGRSLPTETLYRASFASWEEANTTQRSKSRRKHDRQQGERLDALGKVEFEAISGKDAAAPEVLATMFRQRAERFKVMGVGDPFSADDIARFYDATVGPESTVPVKLHVLRLDGEIVAVRYNIVHGDRLFCLISSMSDDPRIQGGSPGKQCLLRVMQSVFDEGFRTFDMGGGFTDEKRHWCNEQIALRNHYVPLTPAGFAVITAHGAWMSARARVKSNPTLLKWAKAIRTRLHRAQETAPAPAEAE